MGIVVGIIAFLITLAVISSLIERGLASRFLRPYIGLFLIAALIAVLGIAVGTLFGGAQGFFLLIAKLIAVLTCAALCLHLIAMIVRRWL